MKSIIYLILSFAMFIAISTAENNKCNEIYCNNLKNTIENVRLLTKCTDCIDMGPLKYEYYLNCYGCHNPCTSNCIRESI
jgi:hypothetical protein